VIVLVVIVVGLLGSTIVLALEMGRLQDKIEAKDQLLDAARKRSREKEKEFYDYAALVGLQRDGAQKQFEGLKREIATKAPLPKPAGPEGEQGPAAEVAENMFELLEAYADECKDLRAVIARLEGQLAQSKEQHEQTIARDRGDIETKETLIAAAKKVASDLRKDKADVDAELDKTSSALSAQIEDLKQQKTGLIKDVNKWKNDCEIAQRTIKEQKELIEQLKRPKKKIWPIDTTVAGHPVDGKIIRVDADGKHVMINLGRRDWVGIGMEFRVYDNAEPDTQKEKGRLQVRRVYDTIAQAKVLKQDELDPILPGMVIINPAFKRGRRVEFVLQGPFREPNVKQLLSRYPCVIKDEVTVKTDYLVTGEGEIDPEKAQMSPEDSENYSKAKDLDIVVLKENELLRYLGERD